MQPIRATPPVQAKDRRLSTENLTPRLGPVTAPPPAGGSNPNQSCLMTLLSGADSAGRILASVTGFASQLALARRSESFYWHASLEFQRRHANTASPACCKLDDEALLRRLWHHTV